MSMFIVTCSDKKCTGDDKRGQVRVTCALRFLCLKFKRFVFEFHRKLCCVVCSAFVVLLESGFQNSAYLLSPVQTRTEQVTINTIS